MRKDCIMSPWLFNVYMDRAMKEVKMGMGNMGEISGGGKRVEVSYMQMTSFLRRVRGRPKRNGGIFC